jgi:methionyl-tRNA formyltransferase
VRVIFCGNPSFAVPTLQALLNSPHTVAAVVCSPDKPRGRGQKVQPLPVKRVADASGVPVLQPESLKDETFLGHIREFKPDCLTVVAFRILPRELFALPPLGSLNVHPSLLPRGRGPAPIRWTLIRGETETGVTIIQLTEKVDAGAMLKQVRVKVNPNDDFGSLHDRLAELGARMLVEALDEFERGRPPQPITQKEAETTKAPKLFAADRILDWNQPAQDVINRIRALSPSPGAFAVAENFRIKILQAQPAVSKIQLGPGETLAQDSQLHIGTGDGAIQVDVVQPEGRRPMSVAEYLRGRPALPSKLAK